MVKNPIALVLSISGILLIIGVGCEDNTGSGLTFNQKSVCLDEKMVAFYERDFESVEEEEAEFLALARQCSMNDEEIERWISGYGSTPSPESSAMPIPYPTASPNPSDENLFSYKMIREFMPNDNACRIRYLKDPTVRSDPGYIVLSGKDLTHAGTFNTLSSAASALTDYKNAGLCSHHAIGNCDFSFFPISQQYNAYIVQVDGLPMHSIGITRLEGAVTLKNDLERLLICRTNASYNCKVTFIEKDGQIGYQVYRDLKAVSSIYSKLEDATRYLSELKSGGFCR